MQDNIWPRGIKFSSTTLTDHGDYAKTGMMRRYLGAEYVLVKNGAATLVDGAACTATVGQTTAGAGATSIDLIAVIAADTSLPVICANNTGATLAANVYFWGIMRGRGYALGGAAIGDGLDMMLHTTDGTVQGVGGGGTTTQHLGYTISDVTTDVVNSVFWDLPSKRPIA